MRADIESIIEANCPHTIDFERKGAAISIIAALPGMVKPLEWIGREDDCYVHCRMDGVFYEIGVSDELERSCDYVWYASFIDEEVQSKSLGGGTFEDAKAAANAHHAARLMAAFGITPKDADHGN